MRVAGESENTSIRRWKVNVHHYDPCKQIDDFARRESRGQLSETLFQGHVKAIGHESSEDVRFDPIIVMMKNRAK